MDRQRFWTAEKLDQAEAFIREHESPYGAMAYACAKLSERLRTPIKQASLKDALRVQRKTCAREIWLESRNHDGPSVVKSRPPPPPEPSEPWVHPMDRQDRREEFRVEHPPEPIDIEELKERRKRQFERKKEVENAERLIRVDVNVDGPFGIWHCGDPHVDDDGTDIGALERHTELIQKTPALFAGNVGDTTNNWVGRLARLYAQQSTSAAEAWALADWFIRRCRWLYMVAGNHDCWSGAGDPLKWIAAQQEALYKETNVRLGLRTRKGREIRVNIRHDFAGHSQWNPAHGSGKAAQLGVRDHVLINGHKHVSGYNVIKDGQSGIISHCIQVASYKVYDRYAKDKGFRDQHISPCAVTIIDPDATEASLVQVFWEPEPAAEFLTWLRAKRLRGAA